MSQLLLKHPGRLKCGPVAPRAGVTAALVRTGTRAKQQSPALKRFVTSSYGCRSRCWHMERIIHALTSLMMIDAWTEGTVQHKKWTRVFSRRVRSEPRRCTDKKEFSRTDERQVDGEERSDAEWRRRMESAWRAAVYEQERALSLSVSRSRPLSLKRPPGSSSNTRVHDERRGAPHGNGAFSH